MHDRVDPSPAAGNRVALAGQRAEICSGGDVLDIVAPLIRLQASELLMFTRMAGDLVSAMRHCPQPIIAAVDGVCAGAGATVAMASELRLGTTCCKTALLVNRVGAKSRPVFEGN